MPRQIFLATDDMKLVERVKTDSKLHFQFVVDEAASKTAKSTPDDRNNAASLRGIIVDIFILAEADFFVGTFSSNIGRLVYELMLSRRPDAEAESLDIDFCFTGGSRQLLRAVVPHRRKAQGGGEKGGGGGGDRSGGGRSGGGGQDEIDLEVNDVIEPENLDALRQLNLWKGYMKGLNLRTHQRGLFPAFKVEKMIVWEQFDF